MIHVITFCICFVSVISTYHLCITVFRRIFCALLFFDVSFVHYCFSTYHLCITVFRRIICALLFFDVSFVHYCFSTYSLCITVFRWIICTLLFFDVSFVLLFSLMILIFNWQSTNYYLMWYYSLSWFYPDLFPFRICLDLSFLFLLYILPLTPYFTYFPLTLCFTYLPLNTPLFSFSVNSIHDLYSPMLIRLRKLLCSRISKPILLIYVNIRPMN